MTTEKYRHLIKRVGLVHSYILPDTHNIHQLLLLFFLTKNNIKGQSIHINSMHTVGNCKANKDIHNSNPKVTVLLECNNKGDIILCLYTTVTFQSIIRHESIAQVQMKCC